jgi:hypothetical protein
MPDEKERVRGVVKALRMIADGLERRYIQGQSGSGILLETFEIENVPEVYIAHDMEFRRPTSHHLLKLRYETEEIYAEHIGYTPYSLPTE